MNPVASATLSRTTNIAGQQDTSPLISDTHGGMLKQPDLKEIFVITEIDVDTFSAAHADGAYVVDVREPHEYVNGHVPGARLIPLSTLGDSLNDLPASQPIYVICQGGNRSRVAAQYLTRVGRDARSVLGGTSGWMSAGRPVVRGARANLA